MSDQSTNFEKKPTLAFSFSKVKTKTTLSVKSNETIKVFETKKNENEEEKRELIGSIEGKKVKSLTNTDLDEKKKPLVIPCPKNQLNLNPDKLAANTNPEDLEVIKELINDTPKNKNEKKDENLTVALNDSKTKELEQIEDANYEQINIEQFGMAALRGMGWNEKNGIGLSNKRSVQAVVPELRPKGLGLGAGMSSKKHKSDKNQERDESNLRYSKGAYIQIISGKNSDEYGQIVGFDDGLDRILVKLTSNDTTVSLLQSCTQLVSKSDFIKATEKKYKH